MTAAKCPICGKPTALEHRPFCSARCANVDLQRWLSDRYVLPSSDDSEGVEDADDEA